jgi:class 3 adenylate cyclase
VLALTGKGRVLVMRGDVEEGLALLDEGTAAAVGGELDPYSTGLVYCMTISSCHDVGDYRRAAEWTEEASRWCDRLDVTGFPGACRIHRAEILRLRGHLEEAERQAVAACEELHDFERYITANGHYEIGEIRRRRGDHAGADEAYRTADELGREPQPGLALLRLAQGKTDTAAASITRSLADTEEPLARLRRLPARVEIAVAAGDLKGARAAVGELEQIVDAYRIGGRRAPAFEAQVRVAQARIELAEKDWSAAMTLLREARDIWRQVGAPYETAQARMLLALAYRRGGDEEAAIAELEAAAATFDRLGALLDAERTQELLGRLETRRTFLFSDIVDSTRLLETLGDEKWQRLLRRHDELVRERIAESGGQLVKNTGDGVFASFDSPKAAVEAAVGIQRALADEIVAPDVRIGVHTGGAFTTDESATDFGGQGVHIAARIGAAAGAREILVSTGTLDGVATAFSLSDPRSLELKGIKDPVELVSVDWR